MNSSGVNIENSVNMILDNIPIMLTIYDPHTLKYHVNKEFEKVLGWTQQDADTLELMAALFPDADDQKIASEYIQTLQPGFHDYKMKTKEGSMVDTSWSNIKLPDGRQLGIGIDIRSRKRTEEEFLRTQAVLNQAEQMAHLGAWWLDITNHQDLNANPLSWSAEVYRIFGYDPGAVEISNDFFFAHVHPDDRQKVIDAVAQAIAGKHIYSIDHRIIRQDGTERFVLEHGHITFDEQDHLKQIIGTVQDITEQKQAEEKLKTINRELEQFAYVASHDLQEPLRMVANFTELLEKRYKDLFDERGQMYLIRIIEGANRMHLLIEDLLTFSRIGRIDLERTSLDCNTIVNKVIADFAETIRKTGSIISHDNLPVIRANEYNMRQLFQNLISNSIKFRKPTEPVRVHISARKKGSEWLFTVKDNGIGIDPKFFPKVFIIFQRLHNREEYPGTGIGLAICKKIIDTYGGKIWIESEPGQGATFFFTIA